MVSGGVVSGAAATRKDFLFDAESPFASVTASRTYLVPVDSKVNSIAQPSRVCQMVAPVSSSKVQVQLSGPSPVDLVPSSSTGTSTSGLMGAVQIASTGMMGGAGAASTVQLRVAGVGSTLPAASVARTEKVWAPVLRPE